ncbi:MAG: hypothetical protein QXI39_04260 [Candidatus Bathyarchaeia archaeon]
MEPRFVILPVYALSPDWWIEGTKPAQEASFEGLVKEIYVCHRFRPG